MSTAAAKKPPFGGVGRMPASEATGPSSPGASPARNSPRSSTPTTPARARSVRNGAPVSARAAAPRRDAAPGVAESDARAETASAVEDLQKRLEKEEKLSEQFKKHSDVLQSKLDDAVRESAKLEEKVHEHEEQIEVLKNEKREATRQIREMETIYEAERSAILKEKEELANREEEMQTVIQRLKDSLAQRNSGTEEDGRPSRQSVNSSPPLDGGFAPPSSLQRSDSRSNSKLILQKDKLIESLRLELAEAQIKLVESENQGGGRLHEVERLLMEARMANARLMEDNESYQLLLQEKTLKGDFGQGDFSYMNAGAHQDALNALEGKAGGSSLADELSDATAAEGESDRRAEAELKSMKEQNKALTMYINKIIGRLLQHQDFESILDQSGDMKPPFDMHKELPLPPGMKQQASGPSILQRAKSMAGNSGRPKPRPMSFMPSTNSASSAHTDPDTAPSIPIGNLGRSTSTRRTRPQSEQFTGAASLVGQMYRGPDGTASPPLTNPRHSHSFFSPTNPSGNPNAAARTPSGGQASSSGNFPGMRSETSSLSGDSADISTPPSQSPPRSQSDKQTTFAGGKPRPLRLVQENPDALKENKRASWYQGWGWGAKKEEVLSAGSSIPE
ncbi:hypothetical protein HIM_04368 [Hirsutella minnesotensis 3608]|uniref:M protein, serotype 2.1 n=1 Tax=Hirsutella minnesotensis 3608 TaxID=1043627 RepID=A0A0F7ZLD6_9HYPO|nr:hypothetical protein HIM_04368 [Hirsutella minnesotensis 3608]